MQYYTYIILMTIIGAFASLFLKRASGFKNIKSLLMNVNLYVGALLYLGAAVVNIIVLKHMPYSIVLPLTSITYIWTMLLAHFSLGENFGVKKLIGVMLIVIGALVLVQ